MYFIITLKTTKNTKSGELKKFDARTSHSQRWGYVGPFEDKARAERCLVRVAGQFTTLEARLMHRSDIETARARHMPDYGLDKLFIDILKTHCE